MMDSFELTKISAGVLTALLVIFGMKTMIELNAGGHGHGHGEEVVGYALPKPAGEEGGQGGEAATEPAAEVAAFDPANVASLVATASADDGKGVYKKCMSCHTNDAGGANRVGPNLWGVVGREKAQVEGFNYSSALKDKGGAWTEENLASFLHDPKAYASGTKMVFRGISDDQELAQLIAYLATLK